MLAKFKKFVEEILADNSRSAKIAVLEKYKDDEDIRYLLQFIYDPYIITGISEKKLNKELYIQYNSLFIEWVSFDTLKDLLEYLKTHNTGRDDDIATVQITRNALAKEDADLFNRIVTKNLQLGVDAKTINKVMPGLIREFNVQLSNKYFDKPEIVEGKEFAITTKIDGSRIIAMKDNGVVSFWTRQGQPYEGLVDLEKDLLACPFDNFVLDGEIVAAATSKEDTYKNTMKLSRTKDAEKHGLKMLVFDYMEIANFKAQCCPVSYSMRRAAVSAMFDLYKFTYFALLPILYKGTDTSKILELLDEQVNKGEEGIMLNLADAPYIFGRTSYLLKIKKFKDCDLIITGFEEGTNKLQGTLGALILDYKGNELRCGSGFSDEQRAEIWANRDQYLGKIAEIKYFEETYNQNGGISLRFPTFKDIRTDKIEPNY